MKAICVFCGSRTGRNQAYIDAACQLGALCGQAGIEIIYGGGHVGLMGVVADAAMAAAGRVTGLIPEQLLEREAGHRAITELVVTNSMFDRKDKMIARADVFVVLPGGFGTLDEYFEVLTLRQLGYHDKPIVLVNLCGFWTPLIAMLERVADEGFAQSEHLDLFLTVDRVDDILPALGMSSTGAQSILDGKDVHRA